MGATFVNVAVCICVHLRVLVCLRLKFIGMQEDDSTADSTLHNCFASELQTCCELLAQMRKAYFYKNHRIFLQDEHIIFASTVLI